MLPVPFESFLHAFPRKTVADKLRIGNRTFTQPVPTPPVTFVSVGGILKSIAAQNVNDIILNRFDGRRKIGDVVMWIGIQTDDDGIREKLSDFFVERVGIEKLVIDARQVILLETADGFSRAQDGEKDCPLVKGHQCPVALLYFDDAVLN